MSERPKGALRMNDKVAYENYCRGWRNGAVSEHPNKDDLGLDYDAGYTDGYNAFVKASEKYGYQPSVTRTADEITQQPGPVTKDAGEIQFQQETHNVGNE